MNPLYLHLNDAYIHRSILSCCRPIDLLISCSRYPQISQLIQSSASHIYIPYTMHIYIQYIYIHYSYTLFIYTVCKYIVIYYLYIHLYKHTLYIYIYIYIHFFLQCMYMYIYHPKFPKFRMSQALSFDPQGRRTRRWWPVPCNAT